MKGSTIQKAQKKDQPAIFNLIKEVLAGYKLKTDPGATDKDLSDLDAYYFNNGGWFGVIKDEKGVIIGSYGLYKITGQTCELRKMYLSPDWQGKGLGKKMMDDAIVRARKMGFQEMILETNSKLDKAIGLYKKYGFEVFQPKHLSERCDLSLRRTI